eukprot:362521-Chlamydomonas_euryale.AAC.1
MSTGQARPAHLLPRDPTASSRAEQQRDADPPDVARAARIACCRAVSALATHAQATSSPRSGVVSGRVAIARHRNAKSPPLADAPAAPHAPAGAGHCNW